MGCVMWDVGFRMGHGVKSRFPNLISHISHLESLGAQKNPGFSGAFDLHFFFSEMINQ
jgi:hypothetical protein